MASQQRFFFFLCFLLLLVASEAQIITRVISDLHIGSPWFKNPQRHQQLLQFLHETSLQNSTVKTLVFLGDIVEFWMTPLSQKPLGAFKSWNNWNGFDYNAFIELVTKISNSGIQVEFVIRGNHDMELNNNRVHRNLGPNVHFRGDSFVHKNVRFEHGHIYDFFNRPDPLSPRKPFGYYVSRVVSSTGYDEQQSTSQIVQFVLNSQFLGRAAVLLFINDYDIFKEVLIQILTEVYKGRSYDSWKNDIVVEDNGSRRTMEDVLNHYRGLVNRVHEDGVSTGKILKLLKTSYYGAYHYWIKRQPQPVMVLGHTHAAVLKKYQRPSHFVQKGYSKNVVYANSGGWVDGVPPTYIDIYYSSLADNNPKTVYLVNYATSTIQSINV